MFVYVVLTTYDRSMYMEPSVSVHRTHAGAEKRVNAIEAEDEDAEIEIETCELEE